MTEPPMVDFSVGMSDPKSFPVEGMAEAASQAIRSVGEDLTLYPGSLGHLGLRQLMAERESTREGVEVDPAHIALTNGSMQAVTLMARARMQAKGDVIIAEQYTYSGTINSYRGLGARLVGVPVDNHGMQTDRLESTLELLHSQGTKPCFIYTIPTYQNPSAAVMPLERRQQLLEVARRFDVLVVEDNCYADVGFEGEVPPNLYTLAEGEGVVYLCSLSKILAAGIRLGYLLAKPPLLEEIVGQRFDAGNSVLAASICATYLKDRLWDHIEMQNRALMKKRDALLEGLDRHLSEHCTWLRPQGGLFLWLRLPAGVDINRLLALGQERGVGFAPGSSFDVDGATIPYIRLAFGHPTPEEISLGVERLATCVKELAPSRQSAAV